MKHYTKLIRQVCFLLLLLFSGFSLKSQSIDVMLVTGGHAFDTVQFFELFDAIKDI